MWLLAGERIEQADHCSTAYAEVLADIRELRGFLLCPCSVPFTLVSPPLAAVVPPEMVAVLEETPKTPAARQISPPVGASLLTKHRPELTTRQEEIVDTFQQQSPNFAVITDRIICFPI
jgi:hypothetical protein